MSETQHIEYKQSWRDEYFKWICGFANAQGGVLEIGKDDSGAVVGLDDAERLMTELPNKARDLLGVMIDVNLRSKGKRDYLSVRVEPYSNPISYKGEYYYRSGSTNQVLKGAALDRFLLGKTGRRWDAAPVPGVVVKNLDAASLSRFREQAARSKRLGPEALGEDDAGLVEKLRLAEGSYLKRAAVLLFHPDPEQFFTGATVRIGYFESESDLRYHDEAQGGLFTQVGKTMDLLLTKYLTAAISYEGIQRIESYPVPESALREAVLNAVVHRDYAVPAPIQIRVYADHLSIWNPGRLPESWSEAKLLKPHASQPYNPDIANAFFRAGEIEAWGRGIQRVLDACREARTPAPQIRVEPGELWFEFRFSAAYLDSMAGPKTREKTREKTGEKKTREKTREIILDLIRTNPTITAAELAKRVGITAKGSEWQIQQLKQAGRLRRVGGDKGGYWEIIEGGDA